MNTKSKRLFPLILSIVCITYLLSSCASLKQTSKEEILSETNQNTDTLMIADPKTPLDNIDTDTLLGMTEQEAASFAKGYKVLFRVVKEDGQFYPVTKDYRMGRINATIEDGKITDYYVEGKEKPKRKKDKWIGLTEEEAIVYAKEKNKHFRIVKRDGEHLMITMDYIKGRINAAVNKGIVTGYSVE